MADTPPAKLKVFLCHAREDKPIVRELYERLRADGFDPWLDSEALLPGQDWDLEIQKAMRASDAVIVCFSSVSVSKEGYVQKEIKYAQEIQKEKPEGTIFFIPLQLEACEMPFSLRGLHWGHYYEPDGYRKLVEALNVRAGQVRARAKAGSARSAGDLPPGSHLPFPRNAFFTGRAADLQTLAEALLGDHQPGVVVNQAVTGMGGVGKSQLAVEFAYRYGCRFKGVHWLDLRDPAALDSQIALCGEAMGLLPWPEKLPEQVALTLNAWKADPPRLLILDNFETLEAANEVLARLHHSGLRLLLTSRRSDWPPALGLKRLPLEEFSPQESREFLRKYLPPSPAGRGAGGEGYSDAALDQLAHHLGHLPLALELAGRYLAKHPRLTVPAYLAQLDRALEHPSMQGWRPELKSLTGHDLNLLQTFALSWEQVRDETARRIFVTAGYCAPNTPIPPELFAADEASNAETCDECLQTLIDLGLLKEGPAIHPLLAQFARRMDADGKTLGAFSEYLADLAGQTNDEVDRTGNYGLYTPLLPHLRQAAGHANAANLPAAGRLWNALGYHLHAVADYAGAKAAFERAIKIWEANLGAEHPQVATGVNNLGLVLQALGDLAGAKAAFERALKMDEAAYGPDHPSVARDVNNLGSVLQALGDLAGAKAACERALKILGKFLPPNHPNIEIVQKNLDSLKKKIQIRSDPCPKPHPPARKSPSTICSTRSRRANPSPG